MAAEMRELEGQQPKLGIKYQLPSTQSSPFLHKNTNRVIFAEAEKNVFDTMFRFLAFNIRLLKNLNLCSIPNLACNMHSLDEKQLYPRANKSLMLQPYLTIAGHQNGVLALLSNKYSKTDFESDYSLLKKKPQLTRAICMYVNMKKITFVEKVGNVSPDSNGVILCPINIIAATISVGGVYVFKHPLYSITDDLQIQALTHNFLVSLITSIHEVIGQICRLLVMDYNGCSNTLLQPSSCCYYLCS